MTAEINFTVVAVPTRAKGTIVLGTFRTASEAVAAARRFKWDWPEGSFTLKIQEVDGD